MAVIRVVVECDGAMEVEEPELWERVARQEVPWVFVEAPLGCDQLGGHRWRFLEHVTTGRGETFSVRTVGHRFYCTRCLAFAQRGLDRSVAIAAPSRPR